MGDKPRARREIAHLSPSAIPLRWCALGTRDGMPMVGLALAAGDLCSDWRGLGIEIIGFWAITDQGTFATLDDLAEDVAQERSWPYLAVVDRGRLLVAEDIRVTLAGSPLYLEQRWREEVGLSDMALRGVGQPGWKLPDADRLLRQGTLILGTLPTRLGGGRPVGTGTRHQWTTQHVRARYEWLQTTQGVEKPRRADVAGVLIPPGSEQTLERFMSKHKPPLRWALILGWLDDPA